MKRSDEDYAKETQLDSVWNCPTFRVFEKDGMIGADAANLMENSHTMEYVSKYQKSVWASELEEKQNQVEEMGMNIPTMHYELQKEIFQTLLKQEVQFIAGTDFGGGYPLCIPGFGLIEELDKMHDLGMSIINVIKSATINAAEALSRESDLGSIEIGKKANLVIYEDNPLTDLSILSNPESVVLEGKYLNRIALANIRASLKEIINSNRGSESSNTQSLTKMMNFIESPENSYFLKPYILELIIKLLNEVKDIDLIIRLRQQIIQLTDNDDDREKLRSLKNTQAITS